MKASSLAAQFGLLCPWRRVSRQCLWDAQKEIVSTCGWGWTGQRKLHTGIVVECYFT